MVVLPDDSGPKISQIRPRGKPPTPSAASSEMEPLEMTATRTTASLEPSRRMEPLPNCFSIWLRVSPSMRVRSFSSISSCDLSASGGWNADYTEVVRALGAKGLAGVLLSLAMAAAAADGIYSFGV